MASLLFTVERIIHVLNAPERALTLACNHDHHTHFLIFYFNLINLSP